MNKTSISKEEMDLLLQAIREKYLALESTGKAGTEEYRSLRSLEDRLGSIGGEKFQISELKEPPEFQKKVRSTLAPR